MDREPGKRPIGDLLRAMATGSDAHFRDFIKEGLPDMERTLRGVFRRHGIADGIIDDLVQDTLLKVIKTLRKNPSQEVSIAWLFTVARSVRIDRSRRAQREVPVDDEMLSENILVFNTESLLDITNLMSKLSEDHKLILTLIYYECMTVDEAAVRLGIGKEAAYKRHARALKKLRDLTQ